MTGLAAVDLGAQSGRVAVGRFDGSRLEVTEVHRFANEPVLVRGRLQWDVLQLFREALGGLRLAGRDCEIDTVAVDGWAVDFGLVGRDGQLVANPAHYRNARRALAFDSVLARLGARELYARTGIQLIPINTLYELAAMAEDDDPALASAESLLLIPDLFHYWLCGRRVAERTNASTTACFDPTAGAWATDLLERLGIPTGILPEVVPPATLLDELELEVAEATGLGGTRVVAGATHDTACAVAAVPLSGPGSAFLSVGTWSLVGMERSTPLIDDEAFQANVTNEGGVAGTIRVLRNVTGLWLVHECRRAWARQGLDYSFAELTALAGDAPALRSLVDPDDPAFATPGDMPSRIAEACARTQQVEPADPAAIVRCLLESLALKHAQTVEAIGRVTGTPPTELHVVGGGARNELLCRFTAEAAELPVLAGSEEATLIGNLLVQAMALAELAGLEEGRQVVRGSFESRTYEPTGAEEWREARERFALLTGERVPA
jgi:rhamnulokinase